MLNINSCFDELLKEANVLKAVKNALTTPIPGTKPWILGRGEPKSMANTIAKAGPGRSGMRPAVTRRTAGGAYDVSELARQMGLGD